MSGEVKSGRPRPAVLAVAAQLLLVVSATTITACSSTAENNNAEPEGAVRNDVPSCYEHVQVGMDAPTPSRAIFVFVDQTTGLDDRLRETVASNVERLLQPGTSFTISTFSAFSRGNFATVRATGIVEAAVPSEQRLMLPAPKLADLDSCLDQQRRHGLNLAGQTLSEATRASASSFSNSEIMASLSQLSQAVKASSAPDKIVIVVSDLLEHSTTTSFYRHQDLRLIDPEAEMQGVAEHRLIGDFAQARVAIVGAGLLSPNSGEDAIRPREKLNALRSFWEAWFRASRAQLIAYGEPDLHTPIH